MNTSHSHRGEVVYDIRELVQDKVFIANGKKYPYPGPFDFAYPDPKYYQIGKRYFEVNLAWSQRDKNGPMTLELIATRENKRRKKRG